MALRRRLPGDPSSSSSSASPERNVAKRPKNGVRGRRWIITLNDRVEQPPSARWREEAEAGVARRADVDRAYAAAECSEKEEASEAAAAYAGVAGCSFGEVGDREGHFRHPTEIGDGLREHSHLSYYVGQLERGPENGLLHYHFLLEFDQQVALSSVAKLFGEGSGVHCEVAKGTFEQGKTYCTKPSDRVPGTGIFEWGVAPAQGKRKDIDAVRDVLKSGGGMRELSNIASSYQALKSGELLLKYFEGQRDFKPMVYWFHGETGSGKTRRAFDMFEEKRESPSDEAWISGRNLKWFEGYDAHKFVIFDDFRKDFCTFHELLRILDRYPYRVETKGGSRQFLARFIVITCPWSPEVLFNTRSDEDIGQLMRRIDSVEQFGEEVAAPVPSATVSHFRHS